MKILEKKIIKNILIQIFIIIIFFFISFIINKIPNDFVVAAGDFYQPINSSARLDDYFYVWSNQIGQGMTNTLYHTFPFYTIFYILDCLNFNYSIFAGFQIFLILYCSFISFYFSIKIIFKDLDKKLQIFSSLLYALNYFTFTFFVYSWGFTHHILFYVFIPPLISFFISIFSKKEIILKEMVIFIIFFIFSTIAYNNIAFFALLILIQFIIFTLFIILKKITYNKLLLIKIIIIFTTYVIVSIYIFFPICSSLFDHKSKMVNSIALGGDTLDWVKNTSNSVLDIFKFKVFNFEKESNNIINLSYFIILTIIFFLQFNKKKCDNEKSFKNLFSLTILLLIVLMTRIHEPFVVINSLIYKTDFFNFFRSSDKISMLFPFFYIALLVSLLNKLKLKNIYIYLIFFILLITPYKFYTGQLKNMVLYTDAKKVNDYYNFAVKIPYEYYKIKYLIDIEKNNNSIISLPYSVVNSLNWSNYPKWHFVGFDIISRLYDKKYISSNTYDHPNLETKLSFKNFNETNESSEKLLNLIQKFSGEYIIFHKDITQYWIDNSKNIENKLIELKDKKYLNLISSNDFFDLYKVKKEYLNPLINIDEQGNNILYFKKINPTKYKISIKLSKNTAINLNQSYNKVWGIYLDKNPNNSWCEKLEEYNDGGNKVIECKHEQKFFEGEELSYLYKKPIFQDSHKLVYDYANGWTIDPEYIKKNFDKSYYKENPDGSIDIELTLYFKPQSYFYLGLIISGTTLLGCITYLVIDGIKNSKLNTLKSIRKSN